MTTLKGWLVQQLGGLSQADHEDRIRSLCSRIQELETRLDATAEKLKREKSGHWMLAVAYARLENIWQDERYGPKKVEPSALDTVGQFGTTPPPDLNELFESDRLEAMRKMAFVDPEAQQQGRENIERVLSEARAALAGANRQ